MKYIIHDNSGIYIGRSNGNHYMTMDSDSALLIDAKSKAANIANDMRKKFKGHDWVVDTKENNDSNNAKENENQTEVFELDSSFNMIDKINEISNFAKQLELRKQFLIGELQKADLEITDIEHAAEFYELNASQGYKIYKMLHDVRIRRRKIKDELDCIQCFTNAKMNFESICSAKSNIESKANRKYRPRVLNELFGV